MFKQLFFGLSRVRALFLSIFILMIPMMAQGADRLIIEDDSSNTTMVVTDAGFIGIGTTTPAEQVDLGGGGITVNGSDNTGDKVPGLSWAESGRMDFGSGGGGGGNLEVYSKGHASRPGEFRFVYGGGAYGDVRYIHYDGSGWETRMILDRNGRLDMAGGAYCDGSSWVNASSREYKKGIKELTGEEALDTLKGLSPVKFTYKNDPQGENQLGFIAEDVPELVATKDRKGLSSMDVVAVLTKALQEQQKTISELSKELAEIRKELRSKGAPTLAKVRLGD